MTQTDTTLDRIERSIDIDATAEKVWALLERPGWWINEGEVDPSVEVREEDGLHVVNHPKWGEFRLETLANEAPYHLTYRWHDNASGGGTTVDFQVVERPGGVTLTVVESGFQSLEKPRADIENHVRENTQGWESQLAAAQRFLTQGGA